MKPTVKKKPRDPEAVPRKRSTKLSVITEPGVSPQRGDGRGENIPTAWEWILRNAKTLDVNGGIKPFPDYAFARRVVETFEASRIVMVAKSRQMMVTWIFCAWLVYHLLYGEEGLWILLSKGERESTELIRRLVLIIRTMNAHDAHGIKSKENSITFPNGSRILALPATEDAVRMYSPAGVIWDEMAFTAKSEPIWTAVKPAVNSGGRFIGVSTPNGTDNTFYTLFDQDNGWVKSRVHYSEHPERGMPWVEDAKKGLSEARWKQEYEIDFSALADRIYTEYGSESHTLRVTVAQLTGAKLFRAIDFGYRHPYVIWAAMTPQYGLVIFDEWEGENATTEEMVQAIRTIDKSHQLTENMFVWSACDPAGGQASDAGVSSIERLGREGIKCNFRPSEILTGVELVKTMLKDAKGDVRLYFTPNVTRLVYHLLHYRWGLKGSTPLKDDVHDHACDTLRYLIVNLMGTKPVSWSGAVVGGIRR